MSLRTCYIQSFKKTSWDLVFFDDSLPADDPFDFDVNLIQDDFKQSYHSVILLMIGLPQIYVGHAKSIRFMLRLSYPVRYNFLGYLG